MYQVEDFRWPDDAYIARVFNIAWETWPKDLGRAGSTQRANARHLSASPKYRRAMRPIYKHAFAETGGVFTPTALPSTCTQNSLARRRPITGSPKWFERCVS
jgi:hypothetical protein